MIRLRLDLMKSKCILPDKIIGTAKEIIIEAKNHKILITKKKKKNST